MKTPLDPMQYGRLVYSAFGSAGGDLQPIYRLCEI
jgi:hypothetical protein